MFSFTIFLLALAVLHVASTNVTTDLKVAFYINLDRMPTRREGMESQLKSVDLHAQRWNAVSWESVAHGDFDNDYLKPQGISVDLENKTAKSPEKRFGTIACFLSHVTALIEASQNLQPDDIALIMEDDMAIPANWKTQLQIVINRAPKDWQLLKLSGFGAHRITDLVNTSNTSKLKTESLPLPSFSSNLVNASETFIKMASPVWATDYVVKKSNPEDTIPRTYMYWMMHGPFEEPAFMSMGTQGPGTPNLFYGGTGAYVVRGSSISAVISHLRSKPIDDLDSMMLSNGTTHFYDTWPHIFELGGIAYNGPGLHSFSGKQVEEITAAAQEESEGPMRPGVRGKSHTFMGPPAHASAEPQPQPQNHKSHSFNSESALNLRLILYVGGCIVLMFLIIWTIQVGTRKDHISKKDKQSASLCGQ